MANPNYNMPSYDQWVSGGTYLTGKKLDPKDKNMQGYYDNYKTEVKKLIDSGNLAHAKATVTGHGQKWHEAPKFSSSSSPKPKPKPKPKPGKTPAKKYPLESVDYEGPPSQDWRNFDPTPVGIEKLEPLMSEVVQFGPRSEVVENRLASLIDTNSPLFRAASGQAMRRMNASGLANSSMAQEAVMDSILKVAVPIAMADAQTFNRQRMLNQGITNEFRAAQNAAFFGQMQTRLSGAINETLQHISGGYALTQTKINDLTKRYGIDVSSMTQKYGIDVGAETQRYVADLQFQLGMEGIEVDMANILSGVQDNPDAASQLWNMVFGNNMDPTDYFATWVQPFQDS